MRSCYWFEHYSPISETLPMYVLIKTRGSLRELTPRSYWEHPKFIKERNKYK